MDFGDGIYAPGPIKPVAKIKENLAIWTQNSWGYYRIEYIEGMPRGAPMTRDMVNAAGVTTLAANATIAKRVVDILQLNELEFLHVRWEPVDPVEGLLWERAGQAKFQARSVVARVTRSTKDYDPYLATTTFWVLGRDRDMNLEVRNPLGYAVPAARFSFWGYRYVLEDLLALVPEAVKPALRRGDLDTVRSQIGVVTFVPAEGRAS